MRGRGAGTFTRSLLALLGSGSWPFACDLLRARNLLRARDLCCEVCDLLRAHDPPREPSPSCSSSSSSSSP